MLWVATEDAGTCEISEFEKATEKEVLYLMDGYKVNMSNPTKFRVTEMENGRHVEKSLINVLFLLYCILSDTHYNIDHRDGSRFS